MCFEFLPDIAGVSRGEWAAYWCLPSLDKLDRAVVDELQASQLRRFAAERGDLRRPGFRAGLRPTAHLTADRAPVIVAPLAAVRSSPTAALAVPAPFDEVHATLSDAVLALTWEARNGYGDAWNNREIDSAEEAAERRRPGVLLEGNDEEGWRPSRTARAATRLLNERAVRQVPDFVARRYRPLVELQPLDRWLDASPLSLRLTPTAGDPPTSFAIEDVADGLKLWLQLGLLGAVDDLERVTARLEMLADAKADEDRQAWPHQPDESAPAGDDRLDDALADLDVLADPEADPEPLLDPGGDWRAPDRLTRPLRVLLADEPERHLHPRLQRRAARWLAELVAATESPCVVASHSPAFLSLAPGGQMVHISRRDGATSAEPFDATVVEQLSDVAAALGFERGELLAGVSCFLLVEGEHEVAVLEEIFGMELRASKVVLVPLRGSPPKGLLEVDALWRFTTAAVAVALDNIRSDALARAADGDEGALRELRHANSSEEEKALGNLLVQAARHGRELHVLGHPGVDLIDALDPVGIRSAYGAYPEGHAEADAAWQASRERHGKNAGSRKAFYQDKFGIENSVRAYRLMGAAHARLELRPAGLAAIVQGACNAASDADLRAAGEL